MLQDIFRAIANFFQEHPDMVQRAKDVAIDNAEFWVPVVGEGMNKAIEGTKKFIKGQ